MMSKCSSWQADSQSNLSFYSFCYLNNLNTWLLYTNDNPNSGYRLETLLLIWGIYISKKIKLRSKQ